MTEIVQHVPKRGAPPALPGEDRPAYERRMRKARNDRYRAHKRHEADAAKPAAKVAAKAAERAPRPGPIREERTAEPGGMLVFDPHTGERRPFQPGRILGVGLLPTPSDPGSGTFTSFRDRWADEDGPREVREAEWRAAEREPSPTHSFATVVTSAGSYRFDTLDLLDIGRVATLVLDEPGLADIDANELRAALSKVRAGSTFSLAYDEPEQTPESASTSADLFTADMLAPVAP